MQNVKVVQAIFTLAQIAPSSAQVRVGNVQNRFLHELHQRTLVMSARSSVLQFLWNVHLNQMQLHKTHEEPLTPSLRNKVFA
jgi:hypothetical protein